MRSPDGLLDFKLRWADPDGTETMHWKQTSNPYTNAMKKAAGVTGYEAVKVTHTEEAWGGLEYNAGGESLLDGSVGSSSWFYAIGYSGGERAKHTESSTPSQKHNDKRIQSYRPPPPRSFPFLSFPFLAANWGQIAIPAFGRAAEAVELQAMDPKTKNWTLVFRQTMPHLWNAKTVGSNKWNVNANDPNNEMCVHSFHRRVSIAFTTVCP
jgi:hypothetical protein